VSEHPAQQYILTLENGTAVTVELKRFGSGTLWRHEILHGRPPFHYAFYHTFGECFRVACLRVEERCGSPVVRWESRTGGSELEEIVGIIVEDDRSVSVVPERYGRLAL
jgi:hypothetical protein